MKKLNDYPSMDNCPGVVFSDVEKETSRKTVTSEYTKKSVSSKTAKLSKNCSVQRYKDITVMQSYHYEDESGEVIYPWQMVGIEKCDAQICADIASILNDGDTENGLSSTVETFVGTPANRVFTKGGEK